MERHIYEQGKEYMTSELDGKGRCCGIKPVVYKRPNFHTFCCRCHRSHNADGKQISNWAWTVNGEKSIRNKPCL